MKMIGMVFLLLCAAQAHAGTARCLNAPYVAPQGADQERLAEIYQAIEPVLPLITQMDISNTQTAPSLCFADVLDGADGFFEPNGFQIVLRRSLSNDMLSGILLHELRHVDQYLRGHCPTNDVAMKENARAVFAMEADATAVSLMAAWQLKETGPAAIWNALSTWHSQSDIADRFVTEMRKIDDVSAALEGAFDQWYRSEARTAKYYAASCAEYLDRQDDSKILPSYRLLPSDFFEDLCKLPGDTTYTCAEPSGAL